MEPQVGFEPTTYALRMRDNLFVINELQQTKGLFALVLIGA